MKSRPENDLVFFITHFEEDLFWRKSLVFFFFPLSFNNINLKDTINVIQQQQYSVKNSISAAE